MRLDQFLAGKEDVKSRALAQKLIDAGLVLVNGKKVKKASFQVEDKDKVTYEQLPPPAVPTKKVGSTPLPVLYEDDMCMVINKPLGISVHPGAGMAADEITVLDALEPLFAERELPFSAAEVLVHRLDKDTTGCLLIAKTPKAHLELQKQFATRSVNKKYLALVWSTPNPPVALIDAPIGRHSTERTKMSVHRAMQSKSAITGYRTIDAKRGPLTSIKTDVALLECELHTGRTHQIRVHLATIQHPILGDVTYGSSESQDFSAKLGIENICLHAWKLEFDSPLKKKKHVSVECPIPDRFQALIKKIGLRMED